MATFITTLKFTQKGIEAVGDTTRRAADFAAALEKLGGKMIHLYWTLGPNDGLAIFEAPDDETATALMLRQASKGMVHTTTVRAFDTAEMDKILGKVTK